MAITERKTKKPPTFPYHPKNRAKQLKKSWVDNQKIKSKWKAQKRRDGLTKQPPAPAEEEGSQTRDDTKADSDSDSQSQDDRSPPPESLPTTITPSHDKNSLRDLRKLAYTSNSARTQKADPLQRRGVSGNSRGGRGGRGGGANTSRQGLDKGQPNMKLRMNVLLEKIKRDFP